MALGRPRRSLSGRSLPKTGCGRSRPRILHRLSRRSPPSEQGNLYEAITLVEEGSLP